MAPDKLKWIVEADGTYVLESRKGERNLKRKARRRGGKASKRELSREQVPVLMTDVLQNALEPAVVKNILLLPGAHRPIYLRRFHLIVLPPTPPPRTYPAAAMRNPMHTNQQLIRPILTPPTRLCGTPDSTSPKRRRW